MFQVWGREKLSKFFNFSEEIKKSFYYPRSLKRSLSNEASSMDTRGENNLNELTRVNNLELWNLSQ